MSYHTSFLGITIESEVRWQLEKFKRRKQTTFSSVVQVTTELIHCLSSRVSCDTHLWDNLAVRLLNQGNGFSLSLMGELVAIHSSSNSDGVLEKDFFRIGYSSEILILVTHS